MKFLLVGLPLVLIAFLMFGSTEAAVVECGNCSECTSAIASASSGDIIQLNTSISNYVGTDNTGCINFGGADNLTFDCMGHAIDGDGGGSDYGIWLNDSSGGSNNITITNCTVTDFFALLYISSTSNSTLADINISSSSWYGIYMESSSGNVLSNVTANQGYNYGIFLTNSSDNTFTNVSINGSFWGVYVFSGSNNTLTGMEITNSRDMGICLYVSQNNTVRDSRITGGDYGIYLGAEPPNYTRYNLFYNNYLNSTANAYSNDTDNLNYWNASLNCSSWPNIAGGFCMGGNYWTSTGGNFSDTCADSDLDGICDLNYSLDGNNTDYLALARMKLIFVNPTLGNQTFIPVDWIYVNASSNRNLTNCTLEWNNGSWQNYTINVSGGYCYENLTGLPERSYYFRVYGMDSLNSTLATEDRMVSVDLAYPLVNITFPQNGSLYNYTGLYLNFTYNETNPDACWYQYNGTNTTILSCADTNFTALENQTSMLMLWMNDTVGRSNFSTVTFTVCMENWSCTGWSACSGGIQSRTCSDANACGTFSNRPSLSQSCSEPPASGGGGGGAAESNDVSKAWTSILPGAPVSMSISKAGLGFTEIRIEVTGLQSSVRITVAKLDGRPADVRNDVSGKIYQYVSVNAENLNSSGLKESFIIFNVSKSWISSNEIDTKRIYLNRYTSGSWTRLQTTYLGEDKENVRYTARTPGFSYFAITGEVKSMAPANQTPETKCGNTLCEPGENVSCPQDCMTKIEKEEGCKPGQMRCREGLLEVCGEAGDAWIALQSCSPVSSSYSAQVIAIPDWGWVMIIAISSVVAGASVFLRKWIREAPFRI